MKRRLIILAGITLLAAACGDDTSSPDDATSSTETEAALAFDDLTTELGLTPASFTEEQQLVCDEANGELVQRLSGLTNELEPICVGPVLATGDIIESAVVSLDTRFESISTVLTEDGINEFNSIAEQCFDMKPECPLGLLAMSVDGVVIAAPSINAPEFESDQIIISAPATGAEDQIAQILNSDETRDRGEFRAVLIDFASIGIVGDELLDDIISDAEEPTIPTTSLQLEELADTDITLDPASRFGSISAVGESLPVQIPGTESDPVIGEVFATITGVDSDGEIRSIEPNGEPTMVVFVADWSPLSQDFLPQIQALIDDGSSPTDLQVIAIATGSRDFDELIDTSEFDIPVIRDDQDSTAFTLAGGTGTPFVVLLDGDNQVINRFAGIVSDEDLIQLWNPLVEE